LRSERQQSSLALNSQVFSVGYNLDFVDGFAGQAIRGTKNLDWANKIKLLYRGHNNNDDSPSLEARTSAPACD
jgi:hypothetical protein